MMLNFQKGFTLIEFILYIAIFVIIAALSIGFLWNIIFGNTKESSYQEIQQNMRFVLAKIDQEVKKATAINNPGQGSSASSLSLAKADGSLNPTVIDLSEGKLRITYGAGSPIEMTSDEVVVNSISFHNLSFADTPGTVRVALEIERYNPGNRTEYLAVINSTSTISLRAGGAAP